jgi:replicative DNA helicase
MTDSILLDVRRKILGAYLCAEECSINGSHKEILSVRLDEKLFDATLHKAIVRTINKFLDEGLLMCDITVQEFLTRHNMLSTISAQDEYLAVISDTFSTPKQFSRYIEMIIEHKLEA